MKVEMHSWKKVIKYCQEKHGDIQLWNYITALRSCDCASDEWKTLITCLIRGECNEAWNILETRNYLKRILKGDTKKHIRGLSESSKTLPEHYITHSVEALILLSEYYKDIDSETSDLFRYLSYRSFSNLSIDVRKIIEIETKIINRLFTIEIK